MKLRNISGIAVMATGLLLSAVAQAHPKLVSSVPASSAETSSLKKVKLNFSEELIKDFSDATLVMTDRPGKTNEPKDVQAQISAGNDPKTMVITPASPLTAGSYRVEWRAVSSDTHPITGNLAFKVK